MITFDIPLFLPWLCLGGFGGFLLGVMFVALFVDPGTIWIQRRREDPTKLDYDDYDRPGAFADILPIETEDNRE